MRINVEYVGLGNQTGADTKEGNKNYKRTGKIYIRRKIDEMWINKFGKEKNKERPNRDLQDYERKGSNIGTQVLRSQYGKQNQRARCKLNKKRTGIRRNRFFSARVVNPWNDLDEKTVTVD